MDDSAYAERKARLRTAIREHLQRCPLAGDTVEGIVACWLSEHLRGDAEHDIAALLEQMVVEGELIGRRLPDGRILYVRGPLLPSAEEP